MVIVPFTGVKRSFPITLIPCFCVILPLENAISMKAMNILLVLAVLAGTACGCSRGGGGSAAPVQNASAIGSFNADSAYSFVAGQVAFGPRVPGTAGHDSCADYIIDKLHGFGADTVIVQHGEATAFNGDRLPVKNIFAGFNPSVSRRILLAAHYDTRPWADRDPDPAKRMQPVLGANDGASGAGVLLEIARNLAMRAPEIGVDLIFFDCEDYGNPDPTDGEDGGWCLGSEYWVRHMVPYTSGNLPVYGVLLDMVGARDAKFPYEYFSQIKAVTPTMKVWNEAERLGYSGRFVRSVGSAVQDDHLVMISAGIPTTNVIECNNIRTGSFNPSWHTSYDNMSNIDKATLEAVGKTLLNVAYKERLQ